MIEFQVVVKGQTSQLQARKNGVGRWKIYQKSSTGFQRKHEVTAKLYNFANHPNAIEKIAEFLQNNPDVKMRATPEETVVEIQRRLPIIEEELFA